jgi:hypothetical protein
MRSFALLLAWAWLLLMPAAGSSILIRDGKAFIGGYLVSKDDKKVTVRVQDTFGIEEIREFDINKVVKYGFDPARLGKLTKDNPNAYLDYAKELAEQVRDPEAKEYALRLFLIAAYLDPSRLDSTYLRNMSELASMPAEARRLRAMAFLRDAKGDESLLKIDRRKATAEPTTNLKRFQNALRNYCNGDFKSAKGFLEQVRNDEMDSCFRIVPGKMKRLDFLKACKSSESSKSYDEDQMEAILRTEIWVDDHIRALGAATTSTGADSWSRVLNTGQTEAIPPLTLETVTEFDPRACVFRKGKWVVPDSH